MLENSIELTALKMYIESLHGDFTLEEMYTRKRMEIVHSKKI